VFSARVHAFVVRTTAMLMLDSRVQNVHQAVTLRLSPVLSLIVAQRGFYSAVRFPSWGRSARVAELEAQVALLQARIRDLEAPIMLQRTPARAPPPPIPRVAPAVLLAEAHPPPPLPFNATMLSQVKLKRVADSAETAADANAAKRGASNFSKVDESMQAVLQRVLEAKFKNARGSPPDHRDQQRENESPNEPPLVPPRPKVTRGSGLTRR